MLTPWPVNVLSTTRRKMAFATLTFLLADLSLRRLKWDMIFYKDRPVERAIKGRFQGLPNNRHRQEHLNISVDFRVLTQGYSEYMEFQF